VRVDAINTFHVSAGHFASFGVIPRRQNPLFPQVSTIFVAGSIPGSSLLVLADAGAAS
jgi:hypothetical protein